MAFEWDEDKRRSNLEKHGVDFIDAVKIFKNPTVERYDERHDYGEDRRIAIGSFGGSYFVVVYTWRDANRRIISAWKAGRDDQKKYYETLHGRDHGKDG